MSLIDEIQDVPDVYGEAYIQAVRKKDAVAMNAIVRKGFLMGNYTKQLTKEEQDWVFKNIEQSV